MPEEPQPSAGAIRGEDVIVEVQVSWQEAQQGCSRIVRVGENHEKIDIPSGVKNGQAIWFPGRGLAGENGGRPGNLSVRLEVEPEPQRGEDLETQVEILPEEASQGTSKSVRAGDHWVAVSIPAGVTEGQVIRLSGRGAAGTHNGPAGDLLITVHFSSILPVASSGVPRELELPKGGAGERVRFSPMLLVGGVALAAVVGGILWQTSQQKGTAASAGGSPSGQRALVPISTPRRTEETGSPTTPAVPVVETVRVCAETGLLPTPDCPAPEERAIGAGSRPTQSCSRHLKVKMEVCASSGMRAAAHCPRKETRRLAAEDAPQQDCKEHPAPAKVTVLVCATSGLRPSAECPRRVQRAFAPGEAPDGACRTHRVQVTAPAAAPGRTRFCGNCGAAVRGTVRFCGGCGRSL